ncbi:helicase-like protein [Senna tora]|uniref:Helicase-like protein n=1 Tax=Senna tora TaxID=362788 RepID=A0A834TQE6_9FABA|nr:helicase-like protein [Senna tora]
MEHSLRAKNKQRMVETPSRDVTNEGIVERDSIFVHIGDLEESNIGYDHDSATRGFDVDNEEFEEENIEIELDNLSNQEYFDIGDPDWKCQYCGALLWYAERVQKHFNPPE